ncbi:carboxymuconolactone decarboxylase family protein [Polaribacter sp. Z014]|uniref:carboxymuconolactone decarboxylase family protein n=1 Tax=Polaribacter sp. Z014 TaxID=2927126 RepID=UPI0020223269|nr:carboxymuconolactone decarboxylase family protein [Polaribacter sp. Z014]MCL7765441.1 carboxymuconolactone decarboxylase family protein [Polaribacter sp. Z014]
MNTIKKVSLAPKTIETANTLSSSILETSKKRAGMIANMYATMANNDALLDAYTYAYDSFRKNAGFTPQEQEVIFLSMNYENGCEYCMAAHSVIADRMSKVPKEVTDAIRNNTEIPDEKLKALSLFSKIMIEKRGYPSELDIENFLNVGYTKSHILGVITGAAVKTMSNYTNHIFDIPVDKAFESRAWTKN